MVPSSCQVPRSENGSIASGALCRQFHGDRTIVPGSALLKVLIFFEICSAARFTPPVFARIYSIVFFDTWSAHTQGLKGRRQETNAKDPRAVSYFVFAFAIDPVFSSPLPSYHWRRVVAFAPGPRQIG